MTVVIPDDTCLSLLLPNYLHQLENQFQPVGSPRTQENTGQVLTNCPNSQIQRLSDFFVSSALEEKADYLSLPW